MSTKVLTDLDLDNNDLLNVGSGGGGGVATEDEGISVDPAATTLNFVGAGVTATDAGSNVTTVTIPGGGGSSPLTTKGDIYTYDTADQRLPVGTDGQILSANSATGTGLEWIANTGGGGGGRELVSTNRTYYVRSDGNDSNDGLTDNSGGAFLTVQKAIDVAGSLDLDAGIVITIDITTGGSFAGWTWASTDPRGVVLITTTGGATINSPTSGSFTGVYRLEELTFSPGTASSTAAVEWGIGTIFLGDNLDFQLSNIHLLATCNACCLIDGDFTISGNTVIALLASQGSVIDSGVSVINTITISGNPAWSAEFARGDTNAVINLNPTKVTFTGAATGTRYLARYGGILNSPTGGANYYPGNAAGVADTATSGHYIP